MQATLEYVADLTASVTMLLAGYRYNSWPLWGIGLGALILTVCAKNIASLHKPDLNEHRGRTGTP